jgi:2Fe-2S ferredoxin
MSRRLPIVRVEPRGIDIEAEEGETIMAAALRAGYHWPTVCNGQGTCRVCRVEVVSRSENLREPSRFEIESLQGLPPKTLDHGEPRLACQAQVQGDVVVRKHGVRSLEEVAARRAR